MALNVLVWGASPRWPIDAPAAAHNSGDVVFEGGKLGVAVDTNVAPGAASGVNGNTPLFNTRNTIAERVLVVLPVPASQPAGTKLYFPTASLTAGATVQAAPSRSTAVATTLQTSASSATLIGVMRDASPATAALGAYGATLAAPVELAPYPTT